MTTETIVLDPYVKKLVKVKAQQLSRHPEFVGSDVEDLRQEFLLDLLKRLPSFDASKAHWKTFAARLVNNHAARLLAYQRRGIRDVRRNAGALNQVVREQDGELVSLLQTIHEGSKRAPESESAIRRRALELAALRSAVNALTPEQRALCERLSHQDRTEVAYELGLTLAELERRIKTIRQLFAERGIERSP